MLFTQKYAETFRIVKQPSAKSLTAAFRSPGRNNPHSLEKRTVKDFNNLDYEIHLKNSFINDMKKSYNRSLKVSPQNSPSKSQKKQEIINFKISSNPSQMFKINSVPGIDPQNYERLKLADSNNLEETNNSIRNSKFLRSTSTGSFIANNTKRSQDYGLCEFEREKTILGKVQKRYSHHLDFAKKPYRPENINKVWYSKNEHISAIDSKSNKLFKIHSFKSYRPHNSFVPFQALDKFYEDKEGLNLVKLRSDINVRKIEGYNPRPDIPKKQGTQLSYEKNRSLINNKKPIFEISKSPRKLRISKQVISPERGCYR